MAADDIPKVDNFAPSNIYFNIPKQVNEIAVLLNLGMGVDYCRLSRKGYTGSVISMHTHVHGNR